MLPNKRSSLFLPNFIYVHKQTAENYRAPHSENNELMLDIKKSRFLNGVYFTFRNLMFMSHSRSAWDSLTTVLYFAK